MHAWADEWMGGWGEFAYHGSVSNSGWRLYAELRALPTTMRIQVRHSWAIQSRVHGMSMQDIPHVGSLLNSFQPPCNGLFVTSSMHPGRMPLTDDRLAVPLPSWAVLECSSWPSNRLICDSIDSMAAGSTGSDRRLTWRRFRTIRRPDRVALRFDDVAQKSKQSRLVESQRTLIGIESHRIANFSIESIRRYLLLRG